MSSPMEDAVRKELATGGITPANGVAIPLLSPTLGRITMLWADHRQQIQWPMNCGKFPLTMHDKKGGQVGQMRNALVEMVRAVVKNSPKTSVPGVMWLDDDVVPCSPMVMQALLRHDRPIVSGVYFCKGAFPEPLIFPGPSAGTLKFNPAPDTLELGPESTVESWGWAQGLCYIAMEVYERMVTELDIGVDEYGHPEWYKQPKFGVDENGVLITGGTEDFPFFMNAEKLGYRPLIDLSKHAFGWHMDGSTLKGVPEMQFDQWARRLPMVWPARGGRPEVVWS